MLLIPHVVFTQRIVQIVGDESHAGKVRTGSVKKIETLLAEDEE